MMYSMFVGPWILGLALLTSGNVDQAAPSPPPSEKPSEIADAGALQEALVAREKQSWEAWKNRDGRFLPDFLSDDHVEVGFDGVIGKASVVAGVGSPVCVVEATRSIGFG